MAQLESEFASNIERFTGFAELYDKRRPSPPPILLDLLTQAANSPVPELVVDLGCGTGLSTRFWSSKARQVVGVEPSDDMRLRAENESTASNVSYRRGVSSDTGLPDNSADIVTCSQSLHWMDPLPTFTEAARVLRAGGVMAAYDCDWPPMTSAWEADAAYIRFLKRISELDSEYSISDGLRRWSKDEHLARMSASGCFRFTREILVHHIEQGNDERLVGLALSQGDVAGLLKRGLSETDIGINDLREVAERTLGEKSSPWYFCYRVRLGIA
jgi:ubiquinone/menaquinone biosynthesis C-methylase UbiE